MKTTLLVAVLVALHGSVVQARGMAVGVTSGLVSSYSIQTPDIGSCRLKGIADTSDNFKNYASVSGKDATLDDGCARCVKVTRDDDASKAVTAYVLDVCQGCAAGALKLSQAALTTLAVDVNSNNVSVSYKYISCPSSYASGNVKACLMEGASNAYIPLQFYNSQKVIASAKINGVDATNSKDSYLFSATSGQSKEGTSSWFSNVAVELTSVDNETLTGSFVFGAASGCATYTTQFSAASTADGTDGSNSKGGSSGSSDALVPAIIGSLAALFLIIGSVFFIRRRRAARGDVETPHMNNNNDVENQYLTPKAKPSPAAPTYSSDRSHSGKGDPEPRSPTIDYEQSFSPPASFANSGVSLQAADSPVNASNSNAHSMSSGGSTQSYTQKPTTYSFSSSLSNSPRRPKAVTVAQFQAPVVPTYSAPRPNNAYNHPDVVASQSFSDEEGENEGRSSFDIDDMRDTEEMKSMDRGDNRFSAAYDNQQPYVAPNNYAATTVTSPQSYVRATSLRRPSSRAPVRTASSAASDANDSATYSSERQPGSLRESSGYRRDSLSILGYPYAKKNNRSNGGSNVTEMQF